MPQIQADIGPLIALFAKGLKTAESTPEDVDAMNKFAALYGESLADKPIPYQKATYERKAIKQPGWLMRLFGDRPRFVVPPEGGSLFPLGYGYNLPEGEAYYKKKPLLHPDEEKEIEEAGAKFGWDRDKINDIKAFKMLGRDIRTPEEKKNATLDRAYKLLESMPTVETHGEPWQPREEAIQKLPPTMRRILEEHEEDREMRREKLKTEQAYRGALGQAATEKTNIARDALEQSGREFEQKMAHAKDVLEMQRKRYSDINAQMTAALKMRHLDAQTRAAISVMKGQLDQQVEIAARHNKTQADLLKNDPTGQFLPRFVEFPNIAEKWDNLWVSIKAAEAGAQQPQAPIPGGSPSSTVRDAPPAPMSNVDKIRKDLNWTKGR